MGYEQSEDSLFVGLSGLRVSLPTKPSCWLFKGGFLKCRLQMILEEQVRLSPQFYPCLQVLPEMFWTIKHPAKV